MGGLVGAVLPAVAGGLISSIGSKKPKPSTQTQLTGYESLPDFGQDFLRQLIEQGRGYGADPSLFTPQPLRPGQTDALNRLESGIPMLGNQKDALFKLMGGIPGATPINVGVAGFDFGKKADAAFGKASSMFDIASQYIRDSQPFTQRGGSAITGDEIRGGISDFMNPYEDSVIANTTRDIDKYGKGLFSDARSLISDAGGSGSNRGNLLAQDIAKDLTQTVGDFSSNMRQTGFQSAADNALRRLMGDRSNALSAGGQMINAGGAQTGVGGGFTNLGNSLMSARMDMDTLRNNNFANQRTVRNDQINDTKDIFNMSRTTTGDIAGDMMRRVGAGDIFRELAGQQQQVPREQLQMLANLFGLIPQGQGGSQTGAAPGRGSFIDRARNPFTAGLMSSMGNLTGFEHGFGGYGGIPFGGFR